MTSSEVDTSIIGSTDLTLVKSGPATAIAGELVTYTINVTNTGPSVAQSVAIRDNLPDGLSLRASSITRTSGDTPAACGGLACDVGDMAVGETAQVTIVARVETRAADGSMVTNAATVFSDTPENNLANNQDAVDTTVHAVADLAVVKMDLRDPVSPGAGFLYDIAVMNHGPSDAVRVMITDTLGANLSLSTVGPNCKPRDSQPPIVVCTIAYLPAGTTSHILLAVQAGDVADGTILTNTVAVASPITDPVLVNNRDDEETTVRHTSEPTVDLAIKKVSQVVRVKEGGLVTFTMTITNQSAITATNVQVIDQVPSGSTFVSSTVDNPDSIVEFCAPPNLCYLGTLHPSSVATMHLTLRVDEPYEDADLTNAAAVTGDQPDQHPENNVDSATVIVFDSPNGANETPKVPEVPEEPTVITLLNFLATPATVPDNASDVNSISLRWTTGAELNTWGFDLWRSESADRTLATRITPATIVSQNGSDSGYPAAASYEYMDTGITIGILYYYWLAEVEVDGNTNEYGPVSARVGSEAQGASDTDTNMLYLPIVNR